MKRENPVEAVQRLTAGKGAHYVIECSGADVLNQALEMVNRGGSICMAAFSHQPVMIDAMKLVSNNISLYGIRGEGRSNVRRAAAIMKQRRFDARLIHTHTFKLEELPTALKYARERIEDAIKVVVRVREG